MTLLCLLISGLIFPGAIWAVSQVIFPHQANGSFIRDNKGKIVGSSLIGQEFKSAGYFHPRPSAAGRGYDGESSGGTNLGPISRKLVEGTEDGQEPFLGFRELARLYREENILLPGARLPADAITRSASGLDPHISPENAMLQAKRVASARGISPDIVNQLIQGRIEKRLFGLFGEERVNVLELNLSLDRALGRGSVLMTKPPQ